MALGTTGSRLWSVMALRQGVERRKGAPRAETGPVSAPEEVRASQAYPLPRPPTPRNQGQFSGLSAPESFPLADYGFNKYSLAGCLLHLEHCLQFCLETVAEFLRQGSAQMSPPQRGLPCPEIEIRSPHVPRPGHLSSWYTLGFLTCFSVSFYCCFSIFPH